MSEPAVRPSSQELADRVRGAFLFDRSLPDLRDADEALDVLVARLQATEQALDAIEAELGTLPLDHLGPATERSVSKAWAMAREKRPDPELVPRALEGDAE